MSNQKYQMQQIGGNSTVSRYAVVAEGVSEYRRAVRR